MNRFQVFALAILLVFMALTGCADEQAVSTLTAGRIVPLENFKSEFGFEKDISVWLPPGYSKDQKYAVLYMQDGQEIFDASVTLFNQEWRADEVSAQLMSEGIVRNFIIVGIHHAETGRFSEYLPQKPYMTIPETERREFSEIEMPFGGKLFENEIRSDSYLRFLVEELMPYIDQTFPVLSDQGNTFVMGSSMGGLISIYAISEYPDIFGGAACLSTHWPGSMSLESNPFWAEMLSYLEANLPSPQNHRIYFDHGNEGLDAMYGGIQQQVDELMRARGFDETNWITRTFPGADHTPIDWGERLHLPLTFLLQAPSDGAAEAELVIDTVQE